jgi:type IV pilus assembly protein PilX
MPGSRKIHRGQRQIEIPSAARQRGVVLLLTLIVLVAMTLAAIALVRSVNTTNVIAGNLAFRQSTTAAGDKGTEQAISWLENNVYSLGSDVTGAGYHAFYQTFPPGTTTWDQYWNLKSPGYAQGLPTDSAGNTVSYIIERMCNPGSPPTCSVSPTKTNEGRCVTANCAQPPPINKTYYRITSRIVGPRNTVSYTQAIVLL